MVGVVVVGGGACVVGVVVGGGNGVVVGVEVDLVVVGVVFVVVGVGVVGVVVVAPTDGARVCAGLAVTTTDHFPHKSVTLPFACPEAASPVNQYSALPEYVTWSRLPRFTVPSLLFCTPLLAEACFTPFGSRTSGHTFTQAAVQAFLLGLSVYTVLFPLTRIVPKVTFLMVDTVRLFALWEEAALAVAVVITDEASAPMARAPTAGGWKCDQFPSAAVPLVPFGVSSSR